MTGRVLLGILAALRAVLIPGEAALLCSRPLTWPKKPSVLRARSAGRGDLAEVAAEAPAA